jgi:hypothetical protein
MLSELRCSQVQGTLSIVVLQGEICSVIQQQVHHALVPIASSDDEGRVPRHWILGINSRPLARYQRLNSIVLAILKQPTRQ